MLDAGSGGSVVPRFPEGGGGDLIGWSARTAKHARRTVPGLSPHHPRVRLMEPPKTPEEQAELERAIVDMLEGRESTPRCSALQEFFARIGCALPPSAPPRERDD